MSSTVPPLPRAVAVRAAEVLSAGDVHRWCSTAVQRVSQAVAVANLTNVANLGLGRGGWNLSAVYNGRRVCLKVPYEGACKKQFDWYLKAQIQLQQAGVGPKVVWSNSSTGVFVTSWVEGHTLSDHPDIHSMLPLVAQQFYRNAALPLVSPPQLLSLVDWLESRISHTPTDVAPGSVPPTSAQKHASLCSLKHLASTAHKRCHGDANLGNVIVSSKSNPEGLNPATNTPKPSTVWLVDARGVYGDPAYDIAVLAMKATVRSNKLDDAARITARPVAASLAKKVGLDPVRTASWVDIATAARV